MTSALPQAGDIYKVSNLAMVDRKEAYGPTSRRPHGVVFASPDGNVSIIGRSSTMKDLRRGEFRSQPEPTIRLDREGFFSARWQKVLKASTLADGAMAEYLGLLPEPQRTQFCDWADRQ